MLPCGVRHSPGESSHGRRRPSASRVCWLVGSVRLLQSSPGNKQSFRIFCGVTPRSQRNLHRWGPGNDIACTFSLTKGPVGGLHVRGE